MTRLRDRIVNESLAPLGVFGLRLVCLYEQN